MKTIELSAEDWWEIYYALDTKAGMIEVGTYGMSRGVDLEQWAKHLRAIMAAIGPDGQNMTLLAEGRQEP